MDLNYLTIKEALEGLKKRKFSSVELTKACLEQIKKYDKEINAFITVREKEAIKEAKKADKLRKEHESNKLLQIKQILGIPIAAKDLYVTRGTKTTAGSKVLENYNNPQYDASIVKRLKKAGAIIIGKTNEDAWGHGASGENSDFGPTKNPWDLSKVPGGSSSGSAAAVASGMCLAAGGTDTGGSIRSPASFCGLVGLKPTYGRVSRYGIIAMASSLDSIAHIARTVWDVAYYLKVTAGKDPLDATTPTINGITTGRIKSRSYKIGVPKEYFTKGVVPEVKNSVMEAIELLEENGASVSKLSLPHTEYGVATYYIVMSSEVSSNLARYDGIRYGKKRNSFGLEAKRRIMLGTYTLSTGYYEAYYKKAMQVRTQIKKDFERAFEKVDILIAPVAPTTAFKHGEKQNPLEMYLADIFTAPTNLAGMPSLSLPCGFSKERLPIGMQIIGPQFSEELLFRVGHIYQQLTNWHKFKPKL